MNLLFNNKIERQLRVIFLIEAGSAAAYAVFFSGLSLYLTQGQHNSKELASDLTGMFLAFNYFLQFVGGVIANNLITYKRFYFMGSLFGFFGCILLAKEVNLDVGLALCLMSSMVTSVSLNMITTMLYKDNQLVERRSGFLSNYIGMNAGFLIGYFITGFVTLKGSYSELFAIMACLTAISAMLMAIFVRNDGLNNVNKPIIFQYGMTAVFMLALTTIISLLFRYSLLDQRFMILLSIVFLFGVIGRKYYQVNNSEKENIKKYAGYSVLAIVYWSLYMLTPIAFMQIIFTDVQQTFLGIKFPPEWFVNIDSITILLIAPLLLGMSKTKKVLSSSSINYFIISYLFAAFAFSIFLLGLNALTESKIPMWSMLGYLIALTLGEIFISPIGNSLVGELIPARMRAVLTGAWAMNIGIGSLIASFITNKYMIPHLNNHRVIGAHIVQLKNIVIIVVLLLLLLSVILYTVKLCLSLRQRALIEA